MTLPGLVAWCPLGLVLWLPLTAPAGEILFNRDVRPILAKNCFSCHGPDSAARKAGLRLDQREVAVKSGAIAPGKPDESVLVDRIFATDPKELMPPPASHKHLAQAEKELLRQWIAAGATYQPHWSFIAPTRPALPVVKNRQWVRNPIDQFVLARLEQLGLEPAAEADRRTLARRLSLDLTGLPPEPTEVERFAADSAADAYQRLVERLQVSPHWGEHRTRYWLDAARYADTHGLHFDNFREIWTYRDWVIDAFNRNLPFDRFTVEQLAGDLLPKPTLDQRIATGFNRCNITTNEGGTILEENLVLYTRDRTESTARVWLGLTANCEVCHDHKFDPLSQKEFYQLSAFFNNTTQGAMDGNIKDTPPILVMPPPADQKRWDTLPGELSPVEQQVKARRKSAAAEFEKWLAAQKPVKPPAAKLAEAEKQKRLDAWLSGKDKAFGELAGRLAALEKEQAAIRGRAKIAYVTQERPEPPKAYVLFRGEYDKRRDEVRPATPAMLPPMSADEPKNRLGLARWLLRADQPLTARVAVNRFWQELFGTGLVKTAEDFGTTGEQPSHPELLDWLAVEFRDSGWDVKRLFRLMVTSATYRQAALLTPAKRERDPENRFLSRGPRFRMDAEMIRDYALASSGLLVPKIGGPSVRPYQPIGVWEAVAMIGSNTRDYRPDSGQALYRRSLYTFWKRAAPPASMEIFNAPSREVCAARRERTNTPLQALVTLNDPQFIEAARHLAQTVLKQSGPGAEARLQDMARRLLARSLRAEELRVAQDELNKLTAHYQAHPDDAQKLLAVGESKADASLAGPLLAGWTMLANAMMNLDEALNK